MQEQRTILIRMLCEGSAYGDPSCAPSSMLLMSERASWGVSRGTAVEKMEAIAFLCLRGHSSLYLSSVHFLLMASVPELP